jgi:histidyl-tRNA synthetase
MRRRAFLFWRRFMQIQAPKGTRDVLPADSGKWQVIEAAMRRVAAAAGYREVRTPVFEHTELFLRGVGDTTDIVQKEMYTFKDKGERSVTLKPEGTAGAVRAFIEGKLFAESLPCKMYYLNSPIFRYENPQSGRLREHHQFGMECFGGKEPTVEAELITTLMLLLSELGLTGLSVRINSIGCPVCRPAYHLALKEFLGSRLNELCVSCTERFERNPLRILDCKEDRCRALVANAPSMLDMLCSECADHFARLQLLLAAQKIPFEVDSRIVRGLDYYTKTVFEFIMRSGREGLALCGGGRYDGLVEQLGGPPIPAVGFGLGTERILMELIARGIAPDTQNVCDIYIADIGEQVQAFMLTQALRARSVKADCDHSGRSLKAQFRFADKLAAPLIAIVGGDELKRGVIKLRDMSARSETEIRLDLAADTIKDMILYKEQGGHQHG